MGICWYCHWGWPKLIADIYDKAVQMLGGNSHALHYGPSHIVWEDENWDSAEWCLEHFNDYTSDRTENELKIIRWSLEELIKIPIDQRDIEPDEYDGVNPDSFPPPSGIVMIRR